jgi:VWFA-related protein
MIKSCIALLLLSAWSMPFQLEAQPTQTAQPGQPDPTVFKIDSSFVWVPVVVRSEAGTVVGDLPPEDFRLWDDGLPQKIVSVKTDDLPISLVVLMQTGGSASQYFKNYTDLPMLLNKLLGNSTHEVTLVTFDSRVEQIWHFPARADGVKNALRHPARGDSGAAIRDAVHFGVEQLQDEPGRFRRIVLLLSDNSDQGSTLSSESLLEQLGTASTVVYSVAFRGKKERIKLTGDRGKSASLCERCAMPKAIEALSSDTAAQVSSMTGGSFLPFADELSFRAAMLEIAEQVQQSRTLGFQPSVTTPGLHEIRVEMTSSHAKLHVSGRRLYWMKSDPTKSDPTKPESMDSAP